MRKLEISKEVLIDLYETKKLTTFQIAEILGCCQATIWKRLKEFNINSRLPGVKRVNIPKQKLYDLYINKKLSSWKIAEELGIPRGTIHRKLKEYGINTRDLATANTIYAKKDFNGNLSEKAYLIGFRIGDLRARKQYKNSKTICLACSSTIPEQIELIQNLFEKYGRVWIKKNEDKGIIHCEVFVNESFNFLLTKEFPKWILRDKKNFFSFLSGFVDAEGHIGVYRNMARFVIGNYNSDLLFIIYKKLNKYSIKSNKPISDKRKGKMNSQGYKYRENYWSFRINKKEDLLKLFKELKPYLKHANKVKSLNIAIENINNRRNRDWKKKNISR